MSDFFEVVRHLQQTFGWRHVHVQTSDASSFREFEARAPASGLVIGATSNPRSDHDTWGGWMDAKQLGAGSATPLATPLLQEFVVGVVNGYIASKAGALLAPLASAWTGYLAYQMGENGSYWTRTEALYLCCSCLSLDRYVPHSSFLAPNTKLHERRANLLLRPAPAVRWHQQSHAIKHLAHAGEPTAGTQRETQLSSFLSCASSELTHRIRGRAINCTLTRFNAELVRWARSATPACR